MNHKFICSLTWLFYLTGWLFKVELTNPGEIDSLMDETSYKAFLKSEEGE